MEPLKIPVLTPRPLQFGLKTLLAMTAGVALFFATGWWWGRLGYVIFFLLAWLAAIFAIPGWSWNKLQIIAASYLALLFAAMYANEPPQDARHRPPAAVSNSVSNASQLGIGKTTRGND